MSIKTNSFLFWGGSPSRCGPLRQRAYPDQDLGLVVIGEQRAAEALVTAERGSLRPGERLERPQRRHVVRRDRRLHVAAAELGHHQAEMIEHAAGDPLSPVGAVDGYLPHEQRVRRVRAHVPGEEADDGLPGPRYHAGPREVPAPQQVAVGRVEVELAALAGQPPQFPALAGAGPAQPDRCSRLAAGAGARRCGCRFAGHGYELNEPCWVRNLLRERWEFRNTARPGTTGRLPGRE